MRIKASKLAIAIALVGPLAVATAGESFAAPVSSGAVAVVRYQAHATRQYWDYAPNSGYPTHQRENSGCVSTTFGTMWDGVSPYRPDYMCWR
jgi:hypothetical protein